MTTVIQRSFGGGEIDPELDSRIDLTKYMTGFKAQRNMMTVKSSVVTNRPGTQLVCKVGDTTNNYCRLVEFEFSPSQTYILEFGDVYMRVIKNGVQLTNLTVTPITSITQASPGVFTKNSHGFSNNDEVQASGFLGMTLLNGRNFTIHDVTTNTFTLKYNGTYVNTTLFAAYTGGGTLKRVYQIASPFAGADLPTLNYVQSADVMTFTHPNYAPRELARTGDTSWAFTTISFAPTQAAPTSPILTGGAGSVAGQGWAVTAIAPITFEESLPLTLTTSALAAPSPSNHIIFTWTNAAGAASYNVYQLFNGIYCFIGISSDGTTGFTIDGSIAPDSSTTPPKSFTPFNATNLYPSSAFFYQERRCFLNSNSFPERCWMTKSAQYYNLTSSTPIQDDDAIIFDVRGRQVNRLTAGVDLGIALILLTEAGEHACLGDNSGTLKPNAVNRKQYSYNGCGSLRPILINTAGIYANKFKNEVRDIEYRFQINGYGGDDLTSFAKHLFKYNSMTDWAFAKIPNSIVWAVRDDGILLGFTYIKEQQIYAWHRHDTDGFIENVACVSEGSRHAPYLIVLRDTGRFIERMSDRNFGTDIRDAWFLDSALQYDGRNLETLNYSSPIQIQSTNFTWDSSDVYTLHITQAGFSFTAADVGNEFQLNLTDDNGNPVMLRFEVTAYIGAGDVTASLAAGIVPTAYRGVNHTLDWVKAVDVVSGLWHLEGKTVAVIGDGYVIGNPNNSNIASTFTVTNGSITLPHAYGVILVGLPYLTDLQTMNIDNAQGTTADKPMNTNKVNVDVLDSRGLWAGQDAPTGDDPLQDLEEYKCRTDADSYGVPALRSEVIDVLIPANWRKGGSIFLRQVDPLPLTIRSIMPAGFIPPRRA